MSVATTSIEKTFLKCLLDDKKHVSLSILKKVKQQFFQEEKDTIFNINRALFTVLIKYFLKYQDLPTEETIVKVLTTSPYSSDQQKSILMLYAELTLLAPTTAGFQFVLDELKLAYANSLLKQAIKEGLDSLEHNDVPKTIEALKRYIFRIDSDTQDQVSEGTIAESILDRQKEYQELKLNPQNFLGVPTGFPTYDQCTGGLKGGELHIIAAKSSEGKSAMLLNIGYNVQTKTDKSVLYVSIEMPKKQLERRYDALDSDVSYEKLKFGKLSDAEELRYSNALQRQKTRKGQFYIYDLEGTCTPAVLSTKLKELSTQYVFDLIIVDYLNLIQSNEATHSLWEEQGKVADEVRKIARTVNIPILTAVQINREGMKGKSDRYEQQHIALSQFIVNHSDAILSLKVVDPAALEISDIAELNCWFVKNRDGARKSFKIIAAFDRFKMQEPMLTIPNADPRLSQ